jgi:YtkA-like
MAAVLILVVAAAAIACGGAGDAAKLTEVQRVRSGSLDILVLSTNNGLRHGKDAFVIEFRSASNGNPIDVGNVRMSATMPMPGMPMFGTFAIARTDVAGRYAANGELGMAGTWRMAIQWDGSAGQGSVTFPENIQ